MKNSEMNKEYQEIVDIQSNEEDSILSKSNVVGVGVGHKVKDTKETGDTSLTVFVTHKMDPSLLDDSDVIPKNFGKFKTDVIETGEIFAGDQLPATQEELTIQLLGERVRPAMGGYSVGHYKVTAGTIATGVFDQVPYPGIPSKYYILSNNHVLANSNDAYIGDPILQPGSVDGGVYPDDQIGKLSRWITINFEGKKNLVDAAIAETEFHDINREVYWNGYIKGYSEDEKTPWYPNLKIGEIVIKTGRTTNYTSGKLSAFNATVNVNYGGGKMATFVRQIFTTNLSAGGDSGSIVTDYNNNAVGLLFAGSTQVTILNPIFYVRNLLKIRLF
jgi:hypothetical protein